MIGMILIYEHPTGLGHLFLKHRARASRQVAATCSACSMPNEVGWIEPKPGCGAAEWLFHRDPRGWRWSPISSLQGRQLTLDEHHGYPLSNPPFPITMNHPLSNLDCHPFPACQIPWKWELIPLNRIFAQTIASPLKCWAISWHQGCPCMHHSPIRSCLHTMVGFPRKLL